MGELAAFIIGLNLTLEYTITAAAVSRGFADYVMSFFLGIGVALPTWLNHNVVPNTFGLVQ